MFVIVIEKQFPAFSSEVKIQNKYELLNDDNDKRESRGVKSVLIPPSLTRLKKISSRRIKTEEWSRMELCSPMGCVS